MTGARLSRPVPARAAGTALVAVLAVVAALLGAARPAAAGQQEPSRKPLLSLMTGGNTVGASMREDRPRADGYRHVDTPRLIARLRAIHATTYTFGLWDSPTDWDDLRLEFAPAARRAGIDVMVYLVPPSECSVNPDPHLSGRCAEPYRTDFVAWARAIGHLAQRYPNVTGWAIDDFLASDDNRKLFTRDYLERVKGEQEKLAPRVKFYSTLYYDQLQPDTLDLVGGVLDGVIYPYLATGTSTADPSLLEERLDGARTRLQGRDLDLVLLVYAGRLLDSIVPPTEAYVRDVLRRADPYVRDGRLAGVIAYGTPVRLDEQQPSHEYHARTGSGELSLSVSNFTPTTDGGYAQASQRVAVDPRSAHPSVTFHHFDQYEDSDPGYHVKQLLVDGQVVWESDAATDPGHRWLRAHVDLTAALAGKRSATIAFRLFERHGVSWAPVDVGIDDVVAHGLTVRNAGFDRTGGWTLSRNDTGVLPLLYQYHADRPVRIFDTVGAAYARLRGQPFRPVPGRSFPGLHLSPRNQAMYGNGRLEFTVPPDTAIPVGRCASATQRVRVRPGQARYRLSFWHADDVQAANYGQVTKEALIDGTSVWDETTQDFWPWDYVNGDPLQGPVDVSQFVRGHRAVTLTLRLCTTDQVTDYGLTAGFDALEADGLAVRDPGFEHGHAWRTAADAPLTGRVARAG